MIWRADVRMYGLSISGSDRLMYGQGAMQWKLFGLIPFMHALGPDIIHSSAERMNIELQWLLSVLSRPTVKWTSVDPYHLTAHFRANKEVAAINNTQNWASSSKVLSW